jgi:hypothetical protein
MKTIKQTVYLPVELNEETFSVLDEGRIVNKVVETERIIFTPEQLNEYTANVIKQALETAAESKCTYVKVDLDGRKTHPTGLCKQSITNTFEKTFKKFKI